MECFMTTPGFPPTAITRILRLEGATVLLLSVIGYGQLGGNWWLFALLLLLPDITLFGAMGSSKTGAKLYNAAHTYLLPGLLGLLAWSLSQHWAVPFALIWVSHIAMDRTLGYGLKYPGLEGATHLGLIGRAKKDASARAHAA
jgi:hypothetical protein